MSEVEERVISLFDKAISVFLVDEKDNILNEVSERNLVGRLAIYINTLKDDYGFENYYCDTEYNRKQDGQVKTVVDSGFQVINITCDLILHSRGEKKKQDNLLALEVKKANRPESEKHSDKQRLTLMTKKSYDGIWSNDGKTYPEHVCGYVCGIYMEIDAANRSFYLESYSSGHKVKEWNLAF